MIGTEHREKTIESQRKSGGWIARYRSTVCKPSGLGTVDEWNRESGWLGEDTDLGASAPIVSQAVTLSTSLPTRRKSSLLLSSSQPPTMREKENTKKLLRVLKRGRPLRMWLPQAQRVRSRKWLQSPHFWILRLHRQVLWMPRCLQGMPLRNCLLAFSTRSLYCHFRVIVA